MINSNDLYSGLVVERLNKEYQIEQWVLESMFRENNSSKINWIARRGNTSTTFDNEEIQHYFNIAYSNPNIDYSKFIVLEAHPDDYGREVLDRKL